MAPPSPQTPPNPLMGWEGVGEGRELAPGPSPTSQLCSSFARIFRRRAFSRINPVASACW